MTKEISQAEWEYQYNRVKGIAEYYRTSAIASPPLDALVAYEAVDDYEEGNRSQELYNEMVTIEF